MFIKSVHFIGGISTYKDYKAEFLEKYYVPYLATKNNRSGAKEPVELEMIDETSDAPYAL
jgi:hypothetical protein